MASSRVMPSAANTDLGPHRLSPSASASSSSIYSLATADGRTSNYPAGSAVMDDLLRGIYQYASAAGGGSGPAFSGGDSAPAPPQPIPMPPLPPLPRAFVAKTAEEVWKELSDGGGGGGDGGGGDGGEGLGYNNGEGAGTSPEAVVCGEMTLEDFLVRAGAVMEEEVRVPSGSSSGFAVDPMMSEGFGQRQFLEYGDEADGCAGGGRRTWRGGRKRPLVGSEDKAALQRQKRMIKNRESAARSRERKQAYTVKLETLVSQLEEDNARLLREQEELHRMRLQHLSENLIPITEKKKPRRVLRRTRSMEW